MTQYAFYFDSSSCTGCKTCQVACKENHHLSAANLLRRVYLYQGGSWEFDAAGCAIPQNVFSYQMSMACNHCQNPVCVEVCPTGAMQKDPETGIVWTDHEVCIGCGSCVEACPYHAPQIDADHGYAIKCDMCKDEVEAGQIPVCVAACPMRALDWGPLDELLQKYGPGNVEVAPLPLNSTNPALIVNPHPQARPSGSTEGSVLNLAEEL